MSDNGRKASVVYEGNGSQTIFLFPFDYLRKAFIYAQDIKSDNVKDLVQGVDFEMDNNRHIHLNTALKAGHLLRIFRKTTTQPLVDWQDASVLRSADLTLQEVQLLHLAEETSDKVVDSAGLSVDPMNNAIWNANFKRIGNVLDPIEPQDVMTLNYILSKQDNILNQIKWTGQNEINELTTTYKAHKSTLERTGNTERQDIERKGTEQVNKVTATANEELNAIKTKGDEYVRTQTTLKEDTRSYADQTLQNKNLSAGYKEQAQKWAESTESPNNATDDVSDTGRTKSSRSWAMITKTLYTQVKSKMEQLSTMLQQALSSLNEVKTQQSQIKTDMVDVKAAKTEATTQANKSKEYATEALNSANAAKQSAKNAAKFDPSSYDTREVNDTRYVQKITADNTYLSKTTAANTYLTQTEAENTYSKTNDVKESLVQLNSNIENNYLTKISADSTYLTQSKAAYTYVTKSESDRKYLTKSEKAQSAKVADALTGNESLYNYLHRHNNTAIPKTNYEINKLGIFVRYFAGWGQIDNQPTEWGQLINLPVGIDGNESCQLWLQQASGSLWHRGGNTGIPVNNQPFVKFLDTEDMYDGNMLKLPNGARIGVE